MTALPAASAAVTWPRKIASGKFHGLMQTNTPRPRSARRFSSPAGPGQKLALAELGARLHRVIAAEIDRLADFGERVVERLAGLGLQQRGEAPAPCLDEIGRALEAGGAFRRQASASQEGAARAALSIACAASRAVGLDDLAERGAVDGARHGTRLAVPLLAVDERGGAEPFALPPCARRQGRPRDFRDGRTRPRRNSCATVHKDRAAAANARLAAFAGSPTRRRGRSIKVSAGTSLSAARLTKEELAPFSSRRRTRYARRSRCPPTGA